MLPLGFRVAGAYCGLKRNPNREDMAMIVADRPCCAAGVFTQSQVFAASVAINRSRTPSANIRAVIVNSGNANSCTGQPGLDNAHEMTRLTAEQFGADPQQVLVLSTGIIGQQLPMDKIASGIALLASRLGRDESSLTAAARGFMTTDSHHKLCSRTIDMRDGTIRICGIAKGAAMIAPRMATMLAVILTDAALEPPTAQELLRDAVDESFNSISVEGHTSTNDSVILLASGLATSHPLEGTCFDAFSSNLRDVCIELARAIVNDGEGATHLIQIDVRGCATRDDARRIARCVADSPLVKTAIAGADPNWGRIVSAAGYAGVTFRPEKISLAINGTTLYRHGAPVDCDARAVSHSIRTQRETYVELEFGEGTAQTRFWTCDLTQEYVRLNADYHT